MKKLLSTLFICIPCYMLRAADVTLSVGNPQDCQRQEVVEVALHDICSLMGVEDTTQLIVRNGFGQEVASQRTYDGKLLLFIAVQPRATATYTISKGEPSAYRSFVSGRMYPERSDDIAWENDVSIYRVYGPALQRSGERSFGTDVWVKNTPELVAEHRYRQHLWGVRQCDSLKAAGKSKEANDIYMATSFHHDHGYGLDCYGVGASLGCGAPALMKAGKLIFPYCYKDYRILDNGPLRFTVELTYNTDADGVTEHRLISLDRGSHFNRMTVWYEGIHKPLALAMGVVLHDDDHLVLGRNYVQYADPTDNPRLHQSQIYVATLFPNAVDETILLKGTPNHGVGIVNRYQGEPYTYYFGSAWSHYDIRNQTQWQRCIDDFFEQLDNPLNISLQ